MGEFEPMGGRTERALVEEEPVATADFVERAFEPERAVTPLDVDESHASSLLSLAAAPAQGDGPDHYRPDSPDDFRVACRDVSMPLPEERS